MPVSGARQADKMVKKDARDVLKGWILGNIENPYPSSEQKQELMDQTGLGRIQLDHWFVNARQRYCRPNPKLQRGPNPNYSRYSPDVTAILTSWLVSNQDRPYPNTVELEQLLSTTKLSKRQLQNWFTNARKRNLVKRLTEGECTNAIVCNGKIQLDKEHNDTTMPKQNQFRQQREIEQRLDELEKDNREISSSTPKAQNITRRYSSSSTASFCSNSASMLPQLKAPNQNLASVLFSSPVHCVSPTTPICASRSYNAAIKTTFNSSEGNEEKLTLTPVRRGLGHSQALPVAPFYDAESKQSSRSKSTEIYQDCESPSDYNQRMMLMLAASASVERTNVSLSTPQTQTQNLTPAEFQSISPTYFELPNPFSAKPPANLNGCSSSSSNIGSKKNPLKRKLASSVSSQTSSSSSELKVELPNKTLPCFENPAFKRRAFFSHICHEGAKDRQLLSFSPAKGEAAELMLSLFHTKPAQTNGV